MANLVTKVMFSLLPQRYSVEFAITSYQSGAVVVSMLLPLLQLQLLCWFGFSVTLIGMFVIAGLSHRLTRDPSPKRRRRRRIHVGTRLGSNRMVLDVAVADVVAVMVAMLCWALLPLLFTCSRQSVGAVNGFLSVFLGCCWC